MARVMEIATPLGGDVLLFHAMTAHEEMSRLFEYQLELLSTKDDINLDEILGQNVSVKLGLPADETRYFNGWVTRFAQGGVYGRYRRYLATVRPWLWFLTRTTDCRIFQEMTVPDIIKLVFADHPVADFKSELTGTYRKWTYCVQYRETDFNFVSRLMEQEGIGYYFRHTAGHDTLVLTDSTSKHTPVEGYERLSYISVAEQVKPDLEHIHAWDFSREVQPGVYVHDDYDLERPSVELKTSKALPRKYTPSEYEIYDYPGEYVQKADGEHYASVRIDELGTQFETAHGATNARGLSVGGLLTLEDHPRADQNREYLITGATYELTFNDYESLPEAGGTTYRCTFAAMPSSQQFRPKRQTPKPSVQGPQTAVVVGPAGEEIYTDKYGRVKAQFHWDRYGKKDETSSCWIRVSHPMAGKGWGAISLPRIGQEVIVDFLEGDPDQPIITGRVYNAEQTPPFELPANQTQSGMRSRSSKGGGGFNEIRMEDSKDNEQIYIHGQRDMQTQVERDVSVAIGRDESAVIKRDQSLAVTNNRSIHVKQNESHIVDVDQKLKVGANRLKEVVGNQTAKVTGVHTLNVKGAIRTDTKANRIENTTGTESRTIGGNQIVNITGNLSYKAAKMVFEAGHIEHKVTGSSSVVHESPNGPYTIMANKFSVLSNTDASILAVGKINYTSMESNTTVMGTNTSGYIGHSSNTAMGLARTTFLGLAMNTFLGASINNTAALQFEAVLAAKLSVSLGPHLEMHPLKMYCPPGGAAAAAGGNVVGEGVAFWATLGALEGMAFGLMSAVVGFGELADQYSAAKAELRDAARDAAAAGHPGLADRLNRLADGGSLEGPDPTSTQLPPAPSGSETPPNSSEPPPDSSEPPPNSSEPPPDSSEPPPDSSEMPPDSGEEPNMSEGPDSEGFERNFSDPDDPGGEAGGGGGGAGGGG